MLRFLIPILTLVTTGCTTSQLEPVPGSITYGGQPATRLTKAPIGSRYQPLPRSVRAGVGRAVYPPTGPLLEAGEP